MILERRHEDESIGIWLFFFTLRMRALGAQLEHEYWILIFIPALRKTRQGGLMRYTR